MEGDLNSYAPVLIPTLNRYEHFRRCVESLSRCTDAEKTELIIGLDYPPSEKYVEGYSRINSFINQITGFKKVTVLDTAVNLNAFVNSHRLWNYAFENGFEAAIYTEDDNEFSPNFLSYCNWALNSFKDDKSILYICGYNLVDVPDLKNNIYIYNHAFSAWGCATWRDRHKKESDNYDFENIKKVVDSYPISIVFNTKVFLASSLLYMLKKKYVLGDTVIQTIPEDQRWCVFPKLSMVRNWGHDGSGLHGGTNESFQRLIRKPIDKSYVFEPHIEGDLFSHEIAQAYKEKYGRKPRISRLRSIGRFLFYKLTGRIVVLERPKWLK